MQTVYATHVDLPDAVEGAPALHVAGTAVVAWVRRRFGVEISSWDQASTDTPSSHVSWRETSGNAGTLREVFVEQTDRGDSRWRWRSYVDIGTEPSGSWARIRVGLYSPVEGIVRNPHVHAGRPGIVRQLADSIPIEIDGWRVDESRAVDLKSVEPYLEFLQRADRRLPVVTLSTDASGEPFLDPAHLADRLMGLAHVVVIDTEATYAVTDAIGKSSSCYLGAVRVYWPGFRRTDDPYRHRLFVGGSLTYLGRDGLVAEIFELIGRVAGLSLGEASLRRALRLEARTAEVEKRLEANSRANVRLVESESAEGGLSAKEYEAFAADFDGMTDRVRELELESLETEREMDRLREERDEARRQIVDVIRELSQANESASPPAANAVVALPTTILEAVELAEKEAEHTVFLQGAFDSARASEYIDPARALDDLRTIEEVARDWATGELSAGPHLAFKQRCSNYRDGISQTAATTYTADYTRDYSGESIVLGPHLRRGVGAPTAILRIYMWFDTSNEKIVIGHVGRKLRDDSNSG